MTKCKGYCLVIFIEIMMELHSVRIERTICAILETNNVYNCSTHVNFICTMEVL